MPPLTVKQVKKLSSYIDDLIKGVTEITYDDINFPICKKFIVSNFLYHRHLDVIAPDVWAKAEKLHEKLVIQAQNYHAKRFSSLVKKLRTQTPTEASSEDALASVLFLLMKISQGTSSLFLFRKPLDYESDSSSETTVTFKEPVALSTLESSYNLLPLNHQVSSSSEDENEDWLDDIDLPNHLPLLQTTSTDSGFEQTPDVEIPPLPTPEPNLAFLNYNSEASQWLHDHILNEKYSFVITEKTLVIEVLWMLQGTRKLSYFDYSFNGFQLKEGVRFSHISHELLSKFLEPFCFYSTCIVQLDNFVNSVTKSRFKLHHVHSKTYEAFACSLDHLFQKLSLPLRKIEKDVAEYKNNWTLVSLLGELSDFFSNVKLLFNLFEEGIADLNDAEASKRKRVAYLLTTLGRKLDEAVFIGAEQIKLNILLTLTLETYKPYMEFIDQVISGSLNDTFGEFAIEQNTGLHSEDEFFWDHVLVLHQISDNYFMFDSILLYILSAGKSVELLAKLRKKDDFHTFCGGGTKLQKSLYERFVNNVFNSFAIKTKHPSFDNFKNSEDAVNFFSLMNQITKPNKLLQLNFEQFLIPKETKDDFPKKSSGLNILDTKFDVIKPFSIVFKNFLIPLIMEKCHASNERALEVLLEDHHLLKHLDFVRAFFLLEEGAPMFYFCSFLFKKILKGKDWRNVIGLNSYLEEIVDTAGFASFGSNFKIVLDKWLPKSSTEDLFFEEIDSIKLVYNVPWPINIIMNKESMISYQKIFSFLMKIKCAKYSLENLKFSENCEWSENLHTLRLLRMKLLRSVNNIHSFFMIGILHETGLELRQEISRASNVKELADVHESYVNKLLKNCFLVPKFSKIKLIILEILLLATNISRYWHLDIDDEKLSVLRNAEYRLNQTIQFFTSVIKIARKQGHCAQSIILAQNLIPMNSEI